MSTISDQLTLLNNTKTAIRTAINNRGGSVTDSTPFADYATEISNLPSGGSGNPLLKSIDVDDFTGTTFNQAANYITDVTIPSGVKSIGNSAFLNCSSLTRIGIPNTVTSIGYSAFSDCTSLASIEIPDRVTTLPNSLFRNCSQLTSFTIGDNISTIDSSAFTGCTGITSVYVSSLEKWLSINFQTGSGYYTTPLSESNKSTLYANGVSIVGELVIPSTITHIEACAFIQYKKITSIYIPDSVTSIGDYAFMNCTSLASATIGNGVTSIGYSAFQNCSSLTYVIVRATTPPTLSNANAFTNTNNCPIYVPAESVEAYKAATNWSTYASRIYPIAQVATVDGNPVYNYEIGNTNATTILDVELAKMPAGTSVEFAEGLTNITAGEINYQEVTLPSTFTGFGDSNQIGSSVTTITSNAVTPPGAFRNQLGGSGLTVIYVPAESVDDYKEDATWSSFASIIQAIPAR